jgi:uncharacterized protein
MPPPGIIVLFWNKSAVVRALALLLAGPALSLPNMLVINSILGPKKTLTFVGLVVVMATLSGLLFGAYAS